MNDFKSVRAKVTTASEA